MAINFPKIGVVVLNHNDLRYTPDCLEAVRRALSGEWRLWVVDNASSDGSSDVIPSQLNDNEIWLEAGANLGYAGGNNVGIREALAWGAQYVLVVNPDCTVEPGFLPPLVYAMEAVPSAGVACPLVLDKPGKVIQSLGGEINLWTGRCNRRLYGRPADEAEWASWLEVDWPHGSCMLLKREFLQKVGLLNEAYFLYYEDVEIGLRARREKWITLAVPGSRVHHRDTTCEGIADPKITFYGTRNQVWVEAEYGEGFQRVTFLLACYFGRWPLKFLARLLRGHLEAAWAVARGAWAGQSSRRGRASKPECRDDRSLTNEP